MLVDLVNVVTSDGMRLDGVLHAPASGAEPPPVADALVCLHGAASNFYGSTLMEAVTPLMLELGFAVLRVNTRGHDGLSTAVTTGGRSRQGAAFEVVDQCRYDIAAWVDYLVGQGYPRVGLLGHSLGGIKAIYSQAHEPHPAVACIIGLSPPRLSYRMFREGANGPLFFETMATAQQHMDEGRPETLMSVRAPLPLVICAAGYVDKYGQAERYNIVKFADRLPCPTLLTYGGMELEGGHVAFAGVPEAIATLPPTKQRLDVVTIAGADHLYTGARSELAAEIARWLRSLEAAG